MISKDRYDLLFGLAVVALVCLVYCNSLGNGFVWDDDIVILRNPVLKGNPIALFSGIDSGRASETTPYYRPLTMLSFMAERFVHGFNPYYVRLVNVLLHAVNSFLVYRFARLITATPYGALVAALLFAIHPINAETVNFNAGGRNTMLATLFVLSSYLVHRRSLRSGTIVGAWGGALLFLAGLLSKETALGLFPFVIGAEYADFHQRKDASWKQIALRLVPYLSVATFYLILRHNALSQAGVALGILPGLTDRLLDNFYIIPRYLLNVVWPGMLSPRYFIPDDLHLYTLQLASAWLCIVGALWWLLKAGRRRTSLFGLAWLVVFWLPVSGVFPIPSAPLADRYCYLPAIGLWLVVADQAGRLISLGGSTRKWFTAAMATVVFTLAAVTVGQNLNWRNDIVLFTRLVSQYPDRAYGYHNLGCAYLDKVKNLDLAERSFEKALALDPFFPLLRTQMGYIRFQRGDLAGALEHYAQALLINPQDGEALLKQGEALELTGRNGEALESYRRFLALPVNELPWARQTIVERVKKLEQ